MKEGNQQRVASTRAEAGAGHRALLLDGLRRFVAAAGTVPGVRRMSLVGSIVTPKPDPKDIDVLIMVSDDADLATLALHARRLRGHAQSANRSADVFLANESGEYIGRTCPWKECRPGIRLSCDARHCGRRPHLHDDLDDVTLSRSLVASPPVTLWPAVERRCALPPDVDEFVSSLASDGHLRRPHVDANDVERRSDRRRRRER